MERIDAIFSFFKAGQGLFYGGRIFHKESNKVYTIVYDCGTSTFIKGNSKTLDNEITYFKNNTNLEKSTNYYAKTNDIDLLFISHLDYDHVSGLKRILTEFKVKNIVLPYIEKQQKNFFLLSFYENKSKISLTYGEYSELIEDTALFINKNSEETTIIFVTNRRKPRNDKEESDNEKIKGNIYANGVKNREIEKIIKQKNVKVYYNNIQFSILNRWEFRTQVKGSNKNLFKKLEDCINKETKNYQAANLSFDYIKRLLITDRKRIKKCYADYIGEINAHGLILLHGPLNYKQNCTRIEIESEFNKFSKDCNKQIERFYELNNKNKRIKTFKTLLLGDISIKPNNNPIKIAKTFKGKTDCVKIVQIPHHGSAKNWDYSNFKKLMKGNKDTKRASKYIAVCNFGYGNKYGHPSHEVLNDIKEKIYFNTQFTRINIKYSITY